MRSGILSLLLSLFTVAVQDVLICTQITVAVINLFYDETENVA